MYNSLSWAEFKDIVTYNNLAISYAIAQGNYYLFAKKDIRDYTCVLNQLYASDFEKNYQQEATLI